MACPFSELQPITIHFDGSVDERKMDGNREYTMDLFHARPGDVVVAKIDLKNGAVAIVPDWKDVVVTGHFAVYEPDRQAVVPEYFHRIIQSNFFKAHLWRNKVGAEGRKEVKLDFFEAQEIPLPPLPVQRAIVRHWQEAQDTIAETREAIRRRQENLEAVLLRRIGLHLLPPSPRKGAFTFAWSGLDRWDTFFYRLDFMDLEKQLCAQKARPLGEVARFVSRPWSKVDFPEGVFGYVEISCVTKEEGITGARLVDVDKAPSRATTLIRAGDIIISTTRPYLGAFAIVPPEYDNFVCTSGFAVADAVDEEQVDKRFLLHFLKGPAGLRQMERRMTGGLYPAIVQPELERIRLPLPPLKVQEDFAAEAENVQEQAKKGRHATAKLSAEVTLEVEEMILGTRPVRGTKA
jgi:type I restriction enzyme S subunit